MSRWLTILTTIGDPCSCNPCILCSYQIFNRISVICLLSYVSVSSYQKKLQKINNKRNCTGLYYVRLRLRAVDGVAAADPRGWHIPTHRPASATSTYQRPLVVPAGVGPILATS